MLGSSVQTIRDTFKHFNSLTDAHGGTNFGAIHYTRIHALKEYVQDRQRCHGHVPDAAGFTNAVMEGYIGKSEVTDTSADSLEVAEPPKLGENNFHQWEDAILAQLRAKKGNNDVPLAYVVRKPTPPAQYADETERLIYEAIQTGPPWEEDKKTVGNYIIGLPAQTPAMTWIKDHMASQDGSAMITALCTHFLVLAQVERIIQYARAKRDKAIYRSQAIYTFKKFSTDLQEAFTLLVEYDTEVPQAEQIHLLREKIMTHKADFNAAAITTLMDGNHLTFADAIAHVSQYVSHFFPAGATFTRRRGTISSINVSQITQEKRGEKFFYNGVGITEFTRHYPRDEWLRIKDLWPQIQAEKDKKVSPKEAKHKSPWPADKQAKAMQKKIKSLSCRVAALQQSEGSVATATTANSNETDNVDEDDKVTGPRAYGRKGKASS